VAEQTKTHTGRAAVGALVTALALGGCGVASTTTTGPPSSRQQAVGIATGLPLVDPPDLNTATPPVLNVRLVARRTVFDIGGKRVWGASYNGSFVGPTLHVVPGEQVDLTLVNHLATPTDLHFHGMHLSPVGYQDDVGITVDPGQQLRYQLQIPQDQPLGTFWYHDHDMCVASHSLVIPADATEQLAPMSTMSTRAAARSCADVESQIFAGLSGSIVVGDDRTLLPPSFRGVPVHTLVLKDFQLDSDGTIVQNTPSESINSDNPTVRLVNGQLRPVLTMAPGETQLWRLANEGADIFYRLQLDGYLFTVVSEDGFPVDQVTTTGTLLLPPGKRYDVLVTAGPTAGSTWLRTLAYSNGPQGDSYPNTALMKVVVKGASTSPLAMPSGAMPGSSRNLADAPIAQTRVVYLSENSAGTKFFINDKSFNVEQSVFSSPAVVNTVEQWTILNESGETHPFHIHTAHFQVMSIDGTPQPFTGEQDEVPVPYKNNGVPGSVVIRIDFADFPGPWMFHCHIAAHEDNGMMSFVNVVAPPPGFDPSLIVPPAY